MATVKSNPILSLLPSHWLGPQQHIHDMPHPMHLFCLFSSAFVVSLPHTCLLLHTPPLVPRALFLQPIPTTSACLPLAPTYPDSQTCPWSHIHTTVPCSLLLPCPACHLPSLPHLPHTHTPPPSTTYFFPDRIDNWDRC